MLLKRIEAKTLPEAIDRVRAECGADALVVDTKPTRDGYLVVAGRPEPAAPRRDQAGATSFLSKWTRGFRAIAEKATFSLPLFHPAMPVRTAGGRCRGRGR